MISEGLLDLFGLLLIPTKDPNTPVTSCNSLPAPVFASGLYFTGFAGSLKYCPGISGKGNSTPATVCAKSIIFPGIDFATVIL